MFTYDEACLSSEMDEKLIELVRKCDELYDISHKKYSDSVWKEKLWEQIGEECTHTLLFVTQSSIFIFFI